MLRTELIPCRGTELAVRHADTAHRPSILFVNAVGMGSDLLDHAAARFRASGLNMVTWELRGCPGPGDSRTVGLRDHVMDGLAILSALAIGEAHVAGWCTGASVAILLAQELGDTALSFASVDGAFLFDGVPGGPLGNAMFAMCAEIVADESRASYFHEVTRPRGNHVETLGLAGHPELADQVMLPYRQGVEGLISYAHAIRATCAYDPAGPCAALSVPAAFFAARRDDRMVAYRNSVRAAGLVRGAQLHVADTGGHYALFTDDEFIGRLAEFMLTAPERARRPHS